MRRTIFWLHLAAGVSAALVIFFLSATGFLLTYERQIIGWVEQRGFDSEGGTRLGADVLLEEARRVSGGRATGLVFRRSPEAPVTVEIGRRDSLLLNPFTGARIEAGASARAFFHQVTLLHRWFALEGSSRDTGRAITGAANLVFLFLLLSGFYLWLPRRWMWRVLKINLLFRRAYPSSKSRDYNWHHVFGIWSLVPMFLIVTTALVFSYGWANTLVFQVYGETPPAGGGPPKALAPVEQELVAELESLESMESLLQIVGSRERNWTTLTLQIAPTGARNISFEISTGTGGQPHKSSTVTLDATSGEAVGFGGFEDRSPGQRARAVIRFLHTGEVLGILGQTLAGLASLGACFLVYSGLALAYRRLIMPLLRK